MSFAEKMRDGMAREREVKRIKKRLNKLKKKKNITREAFCKKNDLDKSQLSRIENKFNGWIAEWETINKISAALDAEGV